MVSENWLHYHAHNPWQNIHQLNKPIPHPSSGPTPPLRAPSMLSEKHSSFSFLMLSMFSSSICFFSFCNWPVPFFSGSSEHWCFIFYERFQIQFNPSRPSLCVCLQFIKTLRREWQWLELVFYRQRRCNGTVFHIPILNRDILFLISCTTSALKPNFSCYLEEVLSHLLTYLHKHLSWDIIVHHSDVTFILWFIHVVFNNALKVSLLNLWQYLNLIPLES